MTKQFITGTRGAIDEYNALCAKALGGPSRGVHIGGGIHVEIPDEPPGGGWTVGWSTPRKHPKRDEWACVAMLAEQCEATLEASELFELTAKEAAAEDLDETWQEDDATADEEPKPAEKGTSL